MIIWKRIWRKIGEMLYSYPRCRNLMPDKLYLQCFWRRVVGGELDFKNLHSLNEKIQWLKIYDRNPLYTIFADKIAVKGWIGSNFGEQYVIPTLAVYDSADAINVEELPEKFILKSNHDSGNYIICTDKSSFNLEEARCKFSYALSVNYYYIGREWPYKNIKKHVIMCEPLLQVKNGGIPNDYKLHFINGELEFVYVSFDRQGVNDRCTYDGNWNRLPFVWIPSGSFRADINTSDVPCPKTFEQMKEFGARVAKNMKYVRVDFYDVDGKLYFGEITLYHGSGFDSFFPPEYDRYFGDKIKLD